MAVPELPMVAPEVLGDLFNELGIEMSTDNLQQFIDLMRVFKLYSERQKVYGGLWQQYGALNNLVRAATKIDRLVSVWWHQNGKGSFHKDALDDAFDGVNYLLFFIRCVMAGNLTGHRIARPWNPTNDPAIGKPFTEVWTPADIHERLALEYGDGHATH